MRVDLIAQDEYVKDLQATVHALRCKAGPPDAKKPKLAEKEWPKDFEIDMKFLATALPPGAKLWYDPRRKRYQVFYQGSSVSRALKTYGSNAAAKFCVRWAWTLYQLIPDKECPIKGLFE